MLAIETRYIGPTNHRGSRVMARVMEGNNFDGRYTPRTLTISWDDALNTDANHYAAAWVLILKLGWVPANGYGQWHAGATEKGYVFVCSSPTTEADRLIV